MVMIRLSYFGKSCATSLMTLLLRDLSTGIPPIFLRIPPNGQKKDSFLIRNLVGIPMTLKQRRPITKSQLLVWGATISTHFFTSYGTPITNVHPKDFKIQFEIFLTIPIVFAKIAISPCHMMRDLSSGNIVFRP